MALFIYGRIVAFATLLCLQIELEDPYRTMILHLFFIKGHGGELLSSQVRKWYTVVISYTQCYLLIRYSPEIRHNYYIRFAV